MKQRAFTLIELLVVVSIIALLIGILLPALGAVRQQARITLCLNNQKQHSIGVLNYAAANGDTLLNAPRSQATDPADVAIIGPRGRASFGFAGASNPLAGFEIQGLASAVASAGPLAAGNFGIPTIVAPLHEGAVLSTRVNDPDIGAPASGRYARFASIYNHYWIPLSTYMVEGSRLQVLQDVFISPSDPGDIRESWDIAREEFTGTGADSYNPTRQLAGGDVNILAPSYRYVPAAYTDSQMWTYRADNSDNPPPVDPAGSQLIGNQTAWELDDWLEYGKIHQIANISFPSKKVLFFLQEAVHNPKVSFWVENGAVSTLAMADGSAVSKIAARDGINPDFKDSAGPWRASAEDPFLDLQIDPDDPSTAVERDAHYLTTLGGITGRDF